MSPPTINRVSSEEPASERVLKAPEINLSDNGPIRSDGASSSAGIVSPGRESDASPPSASLNSPSPAASRSSRAGEGLSFDCEHCGKQVFRAPGQNPADFKRRRFCSHVCSNRFHVAKAKAKRKERRAELATERQKCVVCGKLFGCRPNETSWDFRKRVTCGRGCQSRRIGMLNRARMDGVTIEAPSPKETREQKIAAMFAAIGRDYGADECPIAEADHGSHGYGFRNVTNYSAYGCAAQMCADAGSKSALRF